MTIEVRAICDICGTREDAHRDVTSELGIPHPPDGWVSLHVTSHAVPISVAAGFEYLICPKCRKEINQAVIRSFTSNPGTKPPVI